MVPTASGKVRPASCRDKGRGGVDEGALCLSSLGCDHLASRNPNESNSQQTSTRPNTFQIGTRGVASASSLEPWGRTTMTTNSSKRSPGSKGLGGGTSRFLGLYL